MKTFIVLGMHRSATSLIAKGLMKSGVHMGDRLLGAHASNPYGHWEDVDFINMNDRLLVTAGGSWDDPPHEDKIIEAGLFHSKTIFNLVSNKKRLPFWGWKDPRTSLTIRCYLKYLDNPHFMVCYRSPVDIAESLNKRDGMSLNEGKNLARIYNHRIRKFLYQWEKEF